MTFESAKAAQEWIDEQVEPERYRIDVYAHGNRTGVQVIDICRFAEEK